MRRLKIAVFVSNQGSNFTAIVEACRDKILNSEVVLAVTNNPNAPVIEKSKNLNIPIKVIPPKSFDSFSEWDQKLCETLKLYDADFVVLAGFLKKIGPQLLEMYRGRIINTHPSLLPKFGGIGMYGRRIHEEVIKAGESESGISVHLVTENFDEGPILVQKKVSIVPGETAETLEGKIKQIENTFLVSVLEKIENQELL